MDCCSDPNATAAAQVVFLDPSQDMPLAQSSKLLLGSCQLWNEVTVSAIPLGGKPSEQELMGPEEGRSLSPKSRGEVWHLGTHGSWV